MEIVCPFCRTKYRVANTAAGTSVRCAAPACQKVFTVPAGAAVGPVVANGPVPPPINAPPLPPESGVPPDTQQILANYRTTAKTKTVDVDAIKASLSRGLGAAKKRAQALKIKFDAKNLHKAIDGQYEQLGTLTLTHRPPTIDIQAELAELSTIHADVTHKEATVASLRQTQGSGSAVKSLEQELGQHRQRQRELMIAVGAKTYQSKPDLPATAGAYAAIAQLQSSLATKETDLRALEAEIGPVWEEEKQQIQSLAQSFWHRAKRPLLTAGLLVLVLIVLYFCWSILAAGFALVGKLAGGRSLPAWATYCVPEDVQGVAYVSLERLRKTDLYDDLAKHLPKTAEMARRMGLRLDLDEVSDMFWIAGQHGAELTLFHTQTDQPLEELVPKNNAKPRWEKYKNIDYVQAGSHWAAKTAARTICVAPSEDAIRDVILQIDRRRGAKFTKGLQAAFDQVAGAYYYVAMAAPQESGGNPPPPEGIGCGVSIDSSVRADGMLVFAKPRDAERVAEHFDQMVRSIRQAAEHEFSPSQRIAKAVCDLMRDMKVTQRGTNVEFAGKWPLDDFRDLFKRVGNAITEWAF